MKVFARDSIRSHYVGEIWPEFLGAVELGESFVIETEACGPNGPIEITGIKAGEAIAIHIEAIDLVGPFEAPNGGPFFEGMGPPVEVEYQDGHFVWPEGFRLPARPSVGNVAILPQPTPAMLELSRECDPGDNRRKGKRGWRRIVRDPRGKHCHQDCRAMGVGSTIHMKAQVDGVGLCMDDVHGYIGQGELAFAGIEGRARVQVRVERSSGWLVDWPIIEAGDEIMVFSSMSSADPQRSEWRYADVVREAYRTLREVVAARIGGTIEQANSIVATAADLRNCAIYGLGEGYIPQHKGNPPWDIAVVACLPKEVFD